MHTKTCCPQYTIRLPVSNFSASKSQRQLLKKNEKRFQDGLAFCAKKNADPEGVETSPSSRPPNVVTVETRPAEFTDEVFELYKRYQVAVHEDKLDELTPDKFRDFLVTSSLQLSEREQRGTYHQLYRIDGRLVAVGVVDFLPNSLSSVYGKSVMLSAGFLVLYVI
jgi:arginine-tRNA-protein transferase